MQRMIWLELGFITNWPVCFHRDRTSDGRGLNLYVVKACKEDGEDWKSH